MTKLDESTIKSTAQAFAPPKVKICGIMTLTAAQAAVAHGADFLGLNFVKGRRRCLTVDKAREIIRGLGSACPTTVGLFVDEDPATVRGILAECGLQYAQLCGAETPAYCASLGVPYWKVINLHSPADYARMKPYADAVAFLLEGADNRHGGTGQTWNYTLAAAAPRTRPTLLAGGLNPANVSAAIAQARPWGVDVSSGVETDGKKDPEKIAAFIRHAKQDPALREESP